MVLKKSRTVRNTGNTTRRALSTKRVKKFVPHHNDVLKLTPIIYSADTKPEDSEDEDDDDDDEEKSCYFDPTRRQQRTGEIFKNSKMVQQPVPTTRAEQL
nr:hypothetical protein BaRGS_033164 [Batillaria attramentaria]